MYKSNTELIVIDAKATEPIPTNVVFWSHDKGTAKLAFELKKDPIPQSLAKGTIVPICLDFVGGRHIYHAVIEDAVNGIVSIVLEDNILGYQGRVDGSIYIELPDSRSLDTAGRFTFHIKRSPIDEDVPELEDYYWQGFSGIMEQYHKSIDEIKLESDRLLDKLKDIDNRIDEIDEKITNNNIVTEKKLSEYVKQQFQDTTATQEEAEAGLAKDKFMTPFLVFKAIAKWVQGKFVTPEDLLDKTYPIGAVFFSVNSTSPSLLLGGTWERFSKGRVLVGVDENDAALKTAGTNGGSTNPLTAHTHTIRLTTYRVTSEIGSGSVNNLGRATDQGNAMTGELASASSTGDNTDHKNWQPYIPVYMWKRTA